MRYLFTLLFTCLFIHFAQAANGDTIHVITHNNVLIQTDPSIGHTEYPYWGVFPPTSTSLRKAIIKMTFKCPPGLRCGEWDYSNHIVLKRRGGTAGANENLEIARFITPYGWNFSSTWKFEWYADITDYISLLHDSIEIEYQHSGYESRTDRGWLVTLDFILTEGPPIMATDNIQRLWQGNFRYGDLANDIETHLTPIPFSVNATTKIARLHLKHTGHGGDGVTGCAEFCYPNRSLALDGGVVDVKQILEPCGSIPLYPQAGTWLYDRGNWCPGMMVKPYIWDFNVTPSTSHNIDITMDPYPSASGGAGNYDITAELIHYREPAFTNDIEVYDIKAPSSEYIYGRTGTICSNPIITVRNNGKINVTKFVIEYGIEGVGTFTKYWSGIILPGQKQDIILDNILKPTSTNNQFKVYISWPNSTVDEYEPDNTMYSIAPIPPVYDSTFVFNYKTNLRASENSYTLKDDLGNVLYSRAAGSLANNTTYRDTFLLSPGCYTLHFLDSGGDGLNFWANSAAGTGTAKLTRLNSALIRNFIADFGNEIYHQFMVGDPEYRLPNSVEDLADESSINVFPNPASNYISIDCNLYYRSPATIRVSSLQGAILIENKYDALSTETIDITCDHLAAGTYIVQVKTPKGEWSRKVHIIR